jgi:hypothetical protein
MVLANPTYRQCMHVNVWFWPFVRGRDDVCGLAMLHMHAFKVHVRFSSWEMYNLYAVIKGLCIQLWLILKRWHCYGWLEPCVGLARTVYIRIYTLYIWKFPSQKHRMYTVYIYIYIYGSGQP